MSRKVTVSNRQRTMPVAVSAYERDYEKLRAAVFKNLLKKVPNHLDKKVVKEIAERGEFSVIFVSNRQIRKLNKEWMGKDKPTDVLSFPMELDVPPPGVPWEVGEIVISLERAKEQAKEYGHSFKREMAFLFVHGMLHVMGFDHMTPPEEKEMFGRQRQILEECGITRSI